MRILLAGARVRDLDARTALAALTRGWRQANPAADLQALVASDGEADLLDAVESAHGGVRDVFTAVDAEARHEAPVVVLFAAGTAYLQAGQVLPPLEPVREQTRSPATEGVRRQDGSAPRAGLPPQSEAERLAREGTSFGLGQLVAAALEAGARRVVIGAGPSATLDLGLGLVGALAGGAPQPFDPERELRYLPRVLREARRRLGGTELVLAASTGATVRGLRGAAHLLEPRLGAGIAQELDTRIAPLADALVAAASSRSRADLLAGAPGSPAMAGAGAGAGGALGAAVTALGGRVVPGAGFVAAETNLPHLVRDVDLAVAMSDRIDAVEADSGVIGALARAASRHGVAVLGLSRVGQLDRHGAAPFGISATSFVPGDVVGLEAAGRRLGTAWRW